MSEFVLDCSVTMTWCFADEVADLSLEALGQPNARAWVPAHWVLEVTNCLLVAERRERLAAADSTRFVQLVHSLPIFIAPTVPGLDAELLNLCRQTELTAYDGAYLDLAMRQGLPLATLDDALTRAAERCGVPLVK